MRRIPSFLNALAIAVVILTASGSSIQAKAITDSVAYQGSLTDASSNPVPDGPRDLTISVWTDSVGGTMLYSQLVTVTTSKGLFTACIGCGDNSFPDVFNGQTLFLQMQLAGQAPMAPRTRLRGVPYAMSAASVNAEATGGSTTARGKMLTNWSASAPASELSQMVDKDGNGIPEMTAATTVTGDSAVAMVKGDTDGDGDPEESISQSVKPGTTAVAINTKGTGADKGRTSSVVSGGTFDSASVTINTDVDKDGMPDGEIKNSVTPTTSSVAINTKGTGADKGRTSSLTSGGKFDSMGVSINTDEDGDGLPDATVSQSTNTAGSQLALKTGSGSMPVRISMSLTVGRQTPNTSFGERCDMDGDGNPETQYEQLCTPDSVVQSSSMGNGGGVGGGGAQSSYHMRTRINDLEQRLQNIGLLRTTSTSQYSDDTSGTIMTSVDNGNNGTPNSSASMSAKENRTELKAKFQDGDIPTQSDFSIVQDTSGSHGTWVKTDGGAMNISLSVDAEETRNQLKQYFQRGDKPTQGQFSSLLDAAGVHAGWSNSDGGPVNIGASIDAIETRSILKQYFERGDVPTQSQFTTLLDGTGARSDWSSTTSGAITTLSIVADEGADPITHSSGAKLTAGGVWTNASDENLKENFRPVDGQDLLAKIDELPIRQWNYKNESDTVTHIGPTAQDFKGLFGVGENDKTISTIDPSGIALAGIKELHKENLALKAQNAELRKQLDELKRVVEKLASAK